MEREFAMRQDALEVLQSALTWKLVPHRWETVSQAVDHLADALATDDEDSLAEAVLNLERVGPVRGASEMRTDSPTSPPDELTERVSRLVRTLDGSTNQRSADEYSPDVAG